MPQKSILLHIFQFCFTKFNFAITKCTSVSQNFIPLSYIKKIVTLKSIKLHNFQFYVTKVNFVSQKSILWHKSRFFLTKFETELNVFLTAIDNLQTGCAEFCTDLSTEMNFVKTKITFVIRNHFCWQKRLYEIIFFIVVVHHFTNDIKLLCQAE